MAFKLLLTIDCGDEVSTVCDTMRLPEDGADTSGLGRISRGSSGGLGSISEDCATLAWGSCFHVPPTPTGIHAVYHNRKLTSYADYSADAPSESLVTVQSPAAGPTVLHRPGMAFKLPLTIDGGDEVSTVCDSMQLPEDGTDTSDLGSVSGDPATLTRGSSGGLGSISEDCSTIAYVSGFHAPPTPTGIRRVSCNPKRTFYTDYNGEAPAETLMTVLRLLTEEVQPTRNCVRKVAYAEGSRCGSSLAAVLKMPNEHGQVPLLIATQRRQVEAMTALLGLGVDPDGADPRTGRTALMLAVASGDMAMVQLLLDHGAEVNARSWLGGESALCLALLAGRADLVEVLLAAGCCPGVVGDLRLFSALSSHFERSRAEKLCASTWLVGPIAALLGCSWLLGGLAAFP